MTSPGRPARPGAPRRPPRRPQPIPEERLERWVPAARWLPVALPALLQAVRHFVPGGFSQAGIVTACVALTWSGWVFYRTGRGLSLLRGFQLAAGALATILVLANAADAKAWLEQGGDTVLMAGYTSFVFNLIGSYLPR